MSLEPPELVALRRALGQQLAAARQVAEVGQQQLAHRTGYSRSSVAHAEAGRQLLSCAFWQTADDLLKADGALLAAHEQVQAARQEHELQRREAALAEAYATAQAQRATATLTIPCPDPAQHNVAGLAVPNTQGVPAAGVPLAEQLERFFYEWANNMERRKLLRSLGWSAAALVTSPAIGSLNTDEDERERVVRAVASPSRVDAQVIDHIEAMHRFCQEQDDALGARSVVNTVLAQRELVDELLRECPADLRPRLLAVHSKMSSSIGGYFFDLDDDDRAGYYFEQARAKAHEGHNIELAVHALCNISSAAFLRAKAHTSIDSAAAAHGLVARTNDSSLQAFVGQVAGGGYALDGRYAACMAEFDKAQTRLSTSVRIDPPDSPAYYYHDGILLRRKSTCLLSLRRPQEAVTAASTALALFDRSRLDSLAYATLELGKACLQADDIDEAARVIGEAASLAAQNRSARLVKEIQETRVDMEPWQDTEAVKALDERLASMGFLTKT